MIVSIEHIYERKKVDGLAELLSSLAQDLSDQLHNDATFFIVHPRHVQSKDNAWEAWLQASHDGGGVLFISGSPKGLSEQLLELLNGAAWPRRWHVLTTSIEKKSLERGALKLRFKQFFSHIFKLAGGETIRWQLIEPPKVNQNLVAVYLWSLTSQSCNLYSSLPGPLSAKAASSYAALTEEYPSVTSGEELDWEGINSGDVTACSRAAIKIRKLLEREVTS